MTEPSLPDRPAPPRRPPAKGVERWWFIPAGIMILTYLLYLQAFLDVVIIEPPQFIRTNMPPPWTAFPILVFLVIAIKGLVLMIRKPDWSLVLMILASTVYISGTVIEEYYRHNNESFVVILLEIGWILLGIGYYCWGFKSSPGKKVSGIPLGIQILVLALGLGLLLAVSQTVRGVLHPPAALRFLRITKGWEIIPENFGMAAVAVMVVAAVFRSLRVGGWPDWLQFAGLGVYLALSLTIIIILPSLPPPLGWPEALGFVGRLQLINWPGLIIFAIGFFAARPAGEDEDEV